jgi:hypothetical protein
MVRIREMREKWLVCSDEAFNLKKKKKNEMMGRII